MDLDPGCLGCLLGCLWNLFDILFYMDWEWTVGILGFFFPWGKYREEVNVLPYIILTTIACLVGTWCLLPTILHPPLDDTYYLAGKIAFGCCAYFGLITLVFWPYERDR